MKSVELDKLWEEVDTMYRVHGEQMGLIRLFSALHSGLWDRMACDLFLDECKERDMSVNEVCHILNCLCSIRTDLVEWESFVKYCNKILVRECGPKKAKVLMGVIV